MNEFESNCFNLLYGDMQVKDFEQWVYSYDDLNRMLSSEDYLELISINYNDRSCKYEVKKILDKYLDYGKFETLKIRFFLEAALTSKTKIPNALREFYDMYCRGYYFFDDLGLGYGLTIEVPPSQYKAETWEELNSEEQEDLIGSFYPQIENDIVRAIKWLDDGKIILTGQMNDMDRWEYIDNRNEEEKKSTIWKSPSIEEASRTIHKKKWWEFWKT